MTLFLKTKGYALQAGLTSDSRPPLRESKNMCKETDKTCSTGLSQETSIILSYLLVWIGGVIMLKMERKNRFVRFHAMQSTIYSLFATAVVIVLSLMSFIPLLGFLISIIIKPVFVIVFWISVIFIIVKTTDEQDVRLPVIADLADLWLARLEQR